MLGHDKHHWKDIFYQEDFLKACLKNHMRTKGTTVLELGAGVARVTPIFVPYFETIHLNDIADIDNIKYAW